MKLIFTFKNGTIISFENNEWTDYSYDGKFFSVKNQEFASIAMYNADEVFSVELNK